MIPSTIRRARLLRASVGLLALGALFVAGVGFLHTPAGRPALRWLGHLAARGALCPLGYDRAATAEEKARGRALLAERMRDRPEAASDRALAFRLGVTSRAEVETRVRESGGSCHPAARSESEIECEGKLFNADSSTLWAEFDGAGRLVALRGIERFATAERALAFFGSVRHDLVPADSAVGGKDAPETRGDASPRALSSGLLAQASLSAAYRHLSFTSRVTNLGKAFAVTQDVQSY